MTSRVTCSGSAELSTIIAFWPPVSATNGMIGPSRSASVRLIMRAVSVEPVNTTPASSGCAVSVPPTTLPEPGASWTTSLGMPAWCISSTASAPISGVCPAGLAMTALPAASGADTRPVKIASGKFHGEMPANTPRPCRRSSFCSPVGPGSGSGLVNWRRASDA